MTDILPRRVLAASDDGGSAPDVAHSVVDLYDALVQEDAMSQIDVQREVGSLEVTHVGELICRVRASGQQLVVTSRRGHLRFARNLPSAVESVLGEVADFLATKS